MTLYKIRDWNKLFENAQSRKIKRLSWVPVPNKHDGEGFRLILAEDDGLKIYAAWHLILQVASKCQPRGILARSDGSPLPAVAIALKVGWKHADDIQRALDFCALPAIGWIVAEQFEENKTPLEII